MKYPILILLWIFVFNASNGQDLRTKEVRALDELVMADVKEGSPGVAVGIVRDGQVIYERYAGLADLKENRPIDANTRFNMASSGKQFTALCILQLQAAGQLKLSDDIRKYLPEMFPKIEEPIEIQYLLNHTSGIRDVYALWSLQGITWWKQTLNNADAIELLDHQQELNFKPGSKYMYSNSNYILLTEIIQVITKMSFKDYSDQLFTKLGLSATAFEPDHRKIDQMALPYFNFNTWRGYDWLSDLVGDGALFTTLEDQLAWEVMVQTTKAKAMSSKVLQMSQALIPNSTTDNYGFGVEFGSFSGLKYRYHEGSTGAWKASFLRFPSENLSIVVMTNSGAIYPPNLARECASLVIGKQQLKLEQFPTGPETTGDLIAEVDLLGTYKTDWGYFYRFVKRDGSLFLERHGRDDIELERESDNLYHEKNDPAFKQAFTNNESGGYDVTAYYPTHAPYTLSKIAVNWEGYDFTELNGKYLNGEVEVAFTVKHLKDDLYELSANGEKLEAQLFAPDVLLLDGYRVDIKRTGKGEINQLWVFNNRLQKLRFERVDVD